ncbi:hypothetical protein A6P54_12935 [Bacillus sp. MKU004]|nr:hypothetical protein A6P54_12935 [Bacillus sp. MKU004]
MFFFFAGAAGTTILIFMKWDTVTWLVKGIYKILWFLIKLSFISILAPILITRKVIKLPKKKKDEKWKEQAIISNDIYKHRWK